MHNLSSTVLTADQTLLLSLGLKFIPPCNINKSLGSYIETSFNGYARSVRLRKQFVHSESTVPDFLRIPNPAFQPQKASFEIENYLSVARRRLLKKTRAYQRQLPQQDPSLHWFKTTLASIKALKGIIIKPSDKGFETVVHDLEWYRTECLQQLSVATTYERRDPHYPRVWAQLRLLLLLHGKLFERRPLSVTRLARYLLQLEKSPKLRLARFYCLTKLHKNPIVGRPIVASIDTATFFASKYLDHRLKPFLRRIPSYLQSSEHLLIILERNKAAQPNSVLVAADITSLYPNIPIPEGLRALRAQMLKWGVNAYEVEFIVSLAEWVLKNNYMEFDNVTYHQISGTAMGTPFAVVYANIFLAHLEDQLRVSHPNVIPRLFKRFVDDLFFVADSMEAALAFIAAYNAQYPTIKLTHSAGASVNFMDLRIYMGPRFQNLGLLDVELYSSPTHKYLYLPPWSFHAAGIFPAFISAERRRIRMNCSGDDFTAHDATFRQRLLHRGYTDEFLEPIFAKPLDRATLITAATRRITRWAAGIVATNDDPAPLIFKTPFSPLTKAVRLRHGLKFTRSALDDRDAKEIFTPRSPVMCYTRSENLGDILCSSLFR